MKDAELQECTKNGSSGSVIPKLPIALSPFEGAALEIEGAGFVGVAFGLD